jgi:hypothetical protein
MNIDDSSSKINNMYQHLSYFDNYGSSVFIFIVLIIILFLSFSYFQVMNQLKPIKDDWAAKRCSPKVIPFAGLINKPDNMSVVDFTGQNFTYCMQNILTSITGDAVQPLTYITAGLSEIFKELFEALQFIRNMMANIRASMASIAKEIMGRVLNIMTPLQTIIIAVMDSMQKINGVLTAGLYTSLGTYYALKSLLGAIVQFIIIILIILVGLILGMWILPFTWPLAMTMTAVFVSVAIPMAIIIGFMTDVLHVRTDLSIPGVPKPSCFDKNTNIRMNDGSFKFISEIEVGEKLANDILVTAKMKLDAKGSIMYNLNGTIVSGTHTIKHGDIWMPVSKYPHKILVEKYEEPYLYCLNTETKRIHINDFIFVDWDELTEDDIKQLSVSVSELGVRTKGSTFNSTLDIHTYLDGGFVENTNISLLDGSKREIKDIQVGDVLDGGTKVYGLVEIEGMCLHELCEYNLGSNRILKGGPNINVCDKQISFITTLDLDEKSRKKQIPKHSKLYHLLTDYESFYVDNIKFYHYNSTIELFLDRYRGKLLSMKYV